MSLPHESLIAWQRADDLFLRLHQATQAFPPLERYELGSQIRRAAYSVAANIVEGFGRHSARDRAHFLRIASASLAEVGYGVHVSARLGYLTPEAKSALDTEIRRVSAPLRGLLRDATRTAG